MTFYLTTGNHLCQAVRYDLQRFLPCKHKESGGYQCEREEADHDGNHWFSKHTIMHARAGNGYACESFKEPVALFAYRQLLQEQVDALLAWQREVDARPSVP